LSTNLFNQAFVGRRVIGTVSGCLGLVVFGFERATGGTISFVAATTGAEGATTSVVKTLVPAGLLAAAAIRAANSLATRLFFMEAAVIVGRFDAAMPQLRSIAILRDYECVASECFTVEVLQMYDIEILRRRSF
jgi:hypothetical protein